MGYFPKTSTLDDIVAPNRRAGRHLPWKLWLLTALISLGVVGCPSEQADSQPSYQVAGGEPPPTPVRVATARHDDLVRWVEIIGDLEAQRMVEVAPLESGQLVELLVEEGQNVEAETLIGRLDDELQQRHEREASARVETAEAGEAQARAQLEAQQNEVGRRRPLVEQNAFPEADLRQLEDEVAVLEQTVALAEAQVAEAETALRSARDALERRDIRVLFGGVVAQRHVSEGAMVGPQTPIITLVDESSVQLIVRISERELAHVAPGTVAEIQLDAAPDRWFNATVRRVGRVVEPISRTVELVLDIDDGASALRHGAFVRGRLAAQSTTDVVVVPTGAITYTREGEAVVWTAEDGTAAQIPVTVVFETEEAAAVDGIAAGVDVILAAPMGLRDGTPIVVAEREDNGVSQTATQPEQETP